MLDGPPSKKSKKVKAAEKRAAAIERSQFQQWDKGSTKGAGKARIKERRVQAEERHSQQHSGTQVAVEETPTTSRFVTGSTWERARRHNQEAHAIRGATSACSPRAKVASTATTIITRSDYLRWWQRC